MAANHFFTFSIPSPSNGAITTWARIVVCGCGARMIPWLWSRARCSSHASSTGTDWLIGVIGGRSPSGDRGVSPTFPAPLMSGVRAPTSPSSTAPSLGSSVVTSSTPRLLEPPPLELLAPLPLEKGPAPLLELLEPPPPELLVPLRGWFSVTPAWTPPLGLAVVG